MDDIASETTDEDVPLANLVEHSKKRKSFGRVRDATKRLKSHSYEIGSSCECQRFRCFEVIREEQRQIIISRFNLMKDRNEQNNYLCGLISIKSIQRRRPRKEEALANLREHSYSFKVRIKDGTDIKEVVVCQKAFISFHGITNRTIMTMKKYLTTEGYSGQDMRGKHRNRKHAITKTVYQTVHQHIQSFKGQKSHYSLNKSKRIYLAEDLNIKKM